MPQEYQDPIKSVIDGLLQGHQIASQIKHQRLQEEAYARAAAREEREAGIQEILFDREMRESGARPVTNGMVEEIQQTMLPDTNLGNGVTLPGARISGPVLRKAKGAVTYKGPSGTKQWEPLTPEEQLERQANASQRTRYNEAFGSAKAAEDVLQQMGFALPDEMADFVGMPRGSKVMRDKIPDLLSKGEAAKKARMITVSPGAKVIDSTTKQVVAENPREEPPLTGERAELADFTKLWLASRKIPVDKATPEQQLDARAAFYEAKEAGANKRAEEQRKVTMRGQDMTDDRGRELAEATRENKPATAAQNIVATYAERIKMASPLFEQAEQGMAERLYNKAVPFDIIKTEKGKSFEQAERNFINAVLRRESGAVISPSEFTEARKQYIPQPGDPKELLAQKKANRLVVQQSFIRAAGKAYVDPAKLLQEAEGGTPAAAAAPPPAATRMTATNPQTGAKIESLDGGKTWRPIQK